MLVTVTPGRQHQQLFSDVVALHRQLGRTPDTAQPVRLPLTRGPSDRNKLGSPSSIIRSKLRMNTTIYREGLVFFGISCLAGHFHGKGFPAADLATRLIKGVGFLRTEARPAGDRSSS
jgi:hypothetical protein